MPSSEAHDFSACMCDQEFAENVRQRFDPFGWFIDQEVFEKFKRMRFYWSEHFEVWIPVIEPAVREILISGRCQRTGTNRVRKRL